MGHHVVADTTRAVQVKMTNKKGEKGNKDKLAREKRH